MLKDTGEDRVLLLLENIKSLSVVLSRASKSFKESPLKSREDINESEPEDSSVEGLENESELLPLNIDKSGDESKSEEMARSTVWLFSSKLARERETGVTVERSKSEREKEKFVDTGIVHDEDSVEGFSVPPTMLIDWADEGRESRFRKLKEKNEKEGKRIRMLKKKHKKDLTKYFKFSLCINGQI